MPYKQYIPEKLYYSIGEVAGILKETTSLVRFWSDQFSAFVKPVRNKKGNRKYTPEDVDTLKKIHYLVKVEKMTLEGAAARLKNNRSEVDNRSEVAERLQGIKESLLEVSKMIG